MMTQELLMHARMAVKQANDNLLMTWILAFVGVALVGMYFEYVIRKWSFVPRKRQRRMFGERFGGRL